MTANLARDIGKGYCPYMHGLHVLLDYYIDQQEDKEEGDLNFCFYYQGQQVMKNRFIYFIEQTNNHIQDLPDLRFHEMIQQGLVGFDLGVPKVKGLAGVRRWTDNLLRKAGFKPKSSPWTTRVNIKLKRN